MAYTETKADLEWELWMMDMCSGINEGAEYRAKRRKEIKKKLAEMELSKCKKTLLTKE